MSREREPKTSFKPKIARWGGAALTAFTLGLEKAEPLSAAEQIKPVTQTTEQRPEAEPWQEDIFITALDIDPQNPGRVLAANTHPSMPNWPPRIFEGRYNSSTQEFTWKPISETFPGWRVQGITISPADSNTWVVCGSDTDIFNVQRGFIKITMNNGLSFTDVTLSSDMGNVFGCTFLRDGSGFLVNASNTEGTAGLLKKYNTTGTQMVMANNGLSDVDLGKTVETSPNDINTYYASSGSSPAILKTADGGITWIPWISAPSPIDPWAFRVFNSQGQDVVLASGTVYVITKLGTNPAVTDYTAGFESMAVDTSGSEPRLYGTTSSNDMWERLLSNLTWQSIFSTGLPTESYMRPLNIISTPDGKKYLSAPLAKSNNKSSGFWRTDITSTPTGGTWNQNVNGRDGSPGLKLAKTFLPLVVKSYAGGW